MTSPRYLSLAQAAAMLAISPRTIRRLVAEGHLPASRVTTKPGASVRVSEADVLALLHRIPTA